MNLYVDEKGNYKEVDDYTHYIKNNGSGGLFSYSKEQRKAKYGGGKTFNQMITASGYRKATKEEVEKLFAFTTEKLKASGYKKATEEQVLAYYGQKTKVEKVTEESPDQSQLTNKKEE